MGKAVKVLALVLLITCVFSQSMANYEIYQSGKKIGVSNFELLKVGNHLQLKSNTTIESSGKKTEFIEEGLLDEGFHPQSYQLTIKEPSNLKTYTAEFSAKQAEIQSIAGTEKLDKTVEWDKSGFLLSGTIPSNLWIILSSFDFNFLGITRVPVLDAQTMSKVELELTKKGEEKIDGERYFKIEGKYGETNIALSIRKEDGVPYRIEWPALKMEAKLVEKPTWAKQEKKPSVSRSSNGKYTALSPAIIGNAEMLKAIRDIEEINANISMNITSFSERVYINRRAQEFEGLMEESGQISGLITIEKKHHRVTGAPNWPLQYPLRTEEHYFLPEKGIDSDDADIKLRAEKAIFPTRNLWDAARAINRWVFINIDYTSDSWGAKETFVNLKGDSRSKALLTVALLRSAGIPARVVGGLLYTGTELQDHFWVEVFLSQGIGWGPMDPTMNDTDDISAAHISLYVGSQDIPITKNDIELSDIVVD